MSKPSPAPAPTKGPVSLLIGTRKGAFILRVKKGRDRWKLAGPHFLGSLISHFVMDPRDGRTLLMGAGTGHLGPTIYRSTDDGVTWKEASEPPKFPKAPNGETGESVRHVSWLAPGHASEPGTWYAGTIRPGLFRSEDGGDTWQPVSGLNDHPMRKDWIGSPQESPPGGARLHSIMVDPRDPKHLYVGMSCGGVFESTDGGAGWTPINQGCSALFSPDPHPEYGHDPHCVRMHPLAPDRLYQQNHCGIFFMDRKEGRWKRVGEAMPKDVGDIGFPIVVHPRNPDCAWVFPMDGTDVWPRTCPGGKPAVYRTRNGGKKWQRQDRGLPKVNAWYTVYRQGMTVDHHNPVGVYFGTTTGQVWGSFDEGASWARLAEDLPDIFTLEAAIGAR